MPLCTSPNFAPTKSEPATAEKFLALYHCDHETRIVRNIIDCFGGDFPTLGRVNRLYGEGTAQEWLTYQIGQMNLFCGTQKMTGQQLITLCEYIANDFYYLKVTEVVYFFHQIKMGEYGSFFGKVDPQKITEALIKYFLPKRAAILEKIEQQKREEKEEIEKKNAKYAPDWIIKKHGLKKGEPLSNVFTKLKKKYGKINS